MRGAFQRADQVHVAALRAAGVGLSPAERVLEDLGVFGVVAAEPDLRARRSLRVIVKAPLSGGAVAAAVNEVVENEVWTVENRNRLSNTDAEDRHLFVWLSSSDIVAQAAMDPDEVPAPPRLAPETTTLWVARRPLTHGDMMADRVWQTNGLGEWEALAAVPRRHGAVARGSRMTSGLRRSG